MLSDFKTKDLSRSDLINEFAIKMVSVINAKDLAWFVSREIVGSLGYEDCVIYFFDETMGFLEQVAATGIKNPVEKQILNPLTIEVGDGVTGRVALTKQSILISDLSLFGNYVLDVEPCLSELCVPIMFGDRIYGVLDSESKIIDGYDEEDRKIFEQELTKSNYGLGCDDMIEFILYDSNDNQLPQGEDGKLVKYISIDDVDYKKYFLNLPKNPYTNKPNDSDDYIIDLQQLILDSGYSNGIFKTQVTFLNRRIGSEVGLDKTWIHEVSPSRTEVRILPLKNKSTDEDLEKRYSVFTNKSTFRDDIIYNIREYIDSINLEKIKEFITFKEKFYDNINELSIFS